MLQGQPSSRLPEGVHEVCLQAEVRGGPRLPVSEVVVSPRTEFEEDEGRWQGLGLGGNQEGSRVLIETDLLVAC